MLVIDRNMPPNKSTIAIVEDDASFRRAVERLLRASGFDAQTFGSAEEFLHSPEPESHACLIIDLHLPGMSGIDLVERLTASAMRTPAIFITAQENESFRERASRIPESAYLPKPFPGAALLEAVNAVLKRRGPDLMNPQTESSC
jgi:FixJ family two-component response regulator